MSWQSLTFFPIGENIHDGLLPVLSQAAGQLAGSKGRLSSISGTVPVAKNPLSGGAATVATLRTQLTDLVTRYGQCVCVHPYLHTVGHRRGEYSYLTPNDALTQLGNKLIDAEETYPSGILGAVFILLYGATHSSFVEQLDTFLQVFPVTELQKVQRRAYALSSLETDKFFIPAARSWPEVVQRDPRQHNALRDGDTTLGQLVSVVEGYDEATTPESALTALIDKKTVTIQTAGQAWQDLTTYISGGAGEVMYCEGSLAGLRSELFKGGTPSGVYKLTAAIGWIAQPAQLTVFKEVFGL